LTVTKQDFDGLLAWRCIGPFRGGRVLAVAGDVRQPNVFYFGACAGGVWKTDDAGTYWENISDGFFKTSSVGALTVSEADPNVIYAGMGETTIRIDVSHGDGVYKSTDAGRTWQHMGLADTRHIAKVRVHPHNPDIVYVAAFGHAFGTNKERGVYKSVDGGKTWQHVLFKSEKSGAIDLSIDPNNPRIIYATIWEAYRNFWNISSGGPDSSIWRSTDGGETWQDISGNKGLPDGVLGKMGIAASPAQPGRVWALIESEKGGMYRSDDYGDTWEHVAANDLLISRAWYYMHLTPDPQDGDTVYVNNLSLRKSVDGGRTYTEISTPHGDNHDLWIDPNHPQRMIQGNDGGACVSFNGGASWTTLYNQPTGQFYHVAADNRKPYRVYGTQQDNSSVAVPSRGPNSSISWSDCYPAGTGESGYIAVHPDDPDILYVGAIGSSPGGGNALQRYDHRSQQIRLITTWPEMMSGEGAGQHKYRFAWTYPIVISPHDANTMYAAGNIVFKTTNEGQSWEPISPDLTRADPETLQPTGGPINRDAVGAETYATVYAFAESPHEPGVLWAGSDDGLVHISRDAGANWSNITPSDLPERALISMIELSPHDPATAYIAATRYKLDDYEPYLYKTTDYGQTWKKITGGIREDDFTRVIREDPGRRDLLYAGTETGLYISLDGGVNWQSFQLNLPVTPIYDLLIKDNDLIAGTHGRSFWILDDLTVLHQLQDDSEDITLLQPRDTERVLPKIYEGAFGGAPGKNYMSTLGIVAGYTVETTPENQPVVTLLDSGANPPKGVVVTYFLRKAPAEKIKLAFLDAGGEVIKEFTSLDDATRQAQQEKQDDEGPKPLYATAKAGWNRFIWNMRVEDAVRLEANDPHAGSVDGPMVVPGTYQVRLTVGDRELTQSINIVQDAYGTASQADLQAQYDLLIQIRDKLSEANTAINKMRRLRQQLGDWAERLQDQGDLSDTARSLQASVLDSEKQLIYPDLKAGWPGMLNQGIQVTRKLAALPAVVGCGDYKPTDQAYQVYETLSGEIDALLGQFDDLLTGDLAVFDQQVRDAGVHFVDL
jgi:photosystem II stability/assembly factor-like uncharacterized protein